MQNVETMEAQVETLKKETIACKVKTLKNLDKLYDLLNGDSDINSEEETAALETVAQV